MYIAIVYGVSVVINCAVYKDFDSATTDTYTTKISENSNKINNLRLVGIYEKSSE